MNKRSIPSIDEINRRCKSLCNYKTKKIIYEDDNYGFSDGNNKTGKCGKCYDKILIWNMPCVKTCPGASDWCMRYCYNAAYNNMYEWEGNFRKYSSDSGGLRRELTDQLKELCSSKSIAVRLHSSGDFFSNNYIDFWIKIMKETPNIRYWSYTRSWRVEELSDKIAELHSIPNLSLYYSWDNTMGCPKNKAKLAIVCNNNLEVNSYSNQKEYIICPEQYNLVNSCAECGSCIGGDGRSVVFIAH